MFAVYENDYQKVTQKIARIDWMKLRDWFSGIIEKEKEKFQKEFNKDPKIAVVLERPMINAERFKQSKNAARAFESTVMVIESLNLKESYIVIDSKKWQHWLFGKNTVNLNLKEESKKAGIKYVKSLKIQSNVLKDIVSIINKHGDADGLLIARYAVEKLR